MSSEPVFDRIRALGFRRWYERQLIASHLWLVTCFVSMILVAAGLELMSLQKGLSEFLFDATLILGACMLGWLSWRRYAWLMMHAEAICAQASCPACAHYGFRFKGVEMGRMRALCPKCSEQWLVDDPGDPIAH